MKSLILFFNFLLFQIHIFFSPKIPSINYDIFDQQVICNVANGENNFQLFFVL